MDRTLTGIVRIVFECADGMEPDEVEINSSGELLKVSSVLSPQQVEIVAAVSRKLDDQDQASVLERERIAAIRQKEQQDKDGR